eukprot:PhF_6_TR27118/c0_g1_i4/m.39511
MPRTRSGATPPMLKKAYVGKRKQQLTNIYREVQTIFPELRGVSEYLKSDYFHAVSAEDALAALGEGREYARMQNLIHSVITVVSSQLRVAAKTCLKPRIDFVVSTLEVQRTSVQNATLAAKMLKDIPQQIGIHCSLDTLKGQLQHRYDHVMQGLTMIDEVFATCTIPAFDPNHPKRLTMQQQAVQYVASLIEREIAVSMSDALHKGLQSWGETLFRSLEEPLKSLGMPCWVAGRMDHSQWLNSNMSQTMSRMQPKLWRKVMMWMGFGTELIHAQLEEDLTLEGRRRIVHAILGHYRNNKTKENIIKEYVAIGERRRHELEATVSDLTTKVNCRLQGLDTESLPHPLVDIASQIMPMYYSLQSFPYELVIDEDCEVQSWNHWGTVYKTQWEGKDCYVQLIHTNQRPPVLRYIVQLEHFLTVLVKDQPDSRPHVVAVLMREPPATCDARVDSLLSAPSVDRPLIGVLAGVQVAKTDAELRAAIQPILGDAVSTNEHMMDVEDYFFVRRDIILSRVQTNVRGDDSRMLVELKALGLYTLENPKKSLYSALNSCLRGEIRTASIVRNKCGVFLATVLTGLRKYCRKGAKTLYRGLNRVPDLFETKFSKHRPGGLYWYTFTSTSTSLEQAKKFARLGANGDQKMIFHIEAIEAYDIGFLSRFPKEEEWIMIPGTHFVCTQDPDSTSDSEFIHVYLKQVPSDAYFLP